MQEELLKWLGDYLAQNIPLANNIKLQVLSYANDRLTLSAPLAPNKNDKNTAFAGSQYSLAVLAGWSWVTLKLKELGINHELVVASAEIRYLRPICNSLSAEASVDHNGDWNEFLQTLKLKGKAKIKLLVNLLDGGDLKSQFQGFYAAKIINK